jgi:hypothetical protein
VEKGGLRMGKDEGEKTRGKGEGLWREKGGEREDLDGAEKLRMGKREKG